jgi:hypothetical protein
MSPLLRSDILFFYLVALTANEIDGFVAHLFDRGVPTARPDAVPLPFSSENPPPLVRVLVSLIYPRSIVLFCLLNRTSILLTKSMRTCLIALVRIENKLLMMTLKDLEYLQLSRSPPTRSGPTWQRRSALLPPISLFPLPHRAVVRNVNASGLRLNAR